MGGSQFQASGFTGGHDLTEVDEVLQNSDITAVAVVAMETSTGIVNPVHEIGQRCQRKGLVFFVDAVSALGAEELSVENDYIDFCTSVPNKGLEGQPGIGLVCVRIEPFLSRRPPSPRSMYLDLYRYLDFSEANQTPTTPAVSLISGLEVALDRMLEEGLDNRRRRFQKFSKLILQEIQDTRIKPFITDTTVRANAVLTLCFPSYIDIKDLHEYLLRRGVTVWRPLHPGPLAPYNIIQVSVMGAISESEIKYFLEGLKSYLSENTAKA